jgi:hypothetical protein
MVDDPRSGLDRRAQRRSSASTVAVEEDRRKQGDRRVFSEPREGGPWWLMRDEVSAGKLPGGNSARPWFGVADDLPD